MRLFNLYIFAALFWGQRLTGKGTLHRTRVVHLETYIKVLVSVIMKSLYFHEV